MTILSSNIGGIWGTLLETVNTVSNEKLGDFTQAAIILAAVLAAFSLMKFSTSYVRGEGSFGWDFVRPLLIFMCVMMFPSLCETFDKVVGIFARDIADASGASWKEYGQVFMDGGTTVVRNTGENLWDALNNNGFNIFKIIKDVFVSLMESYYKVNKITTIGLWGAISRTVCEVIFIVFEMLAAVYLIIMRIFGPFVLALSISGMWRNGISSIISRYIQVSLWIPVGYTVLGIITGICKAIVGMTLETSMLSGSNTIGIALCLVSVTSMLAIPKLCGWIIESAGSGNAQSTLERGSSAGLKQLGRRFLFKA